jgi:broad specificity phosphatase PhoE
MSEPKSMLFTRARVALVRHGKEEGAFGTGDPGLSSLGREQALDAARELREHRWQAVVASPAARAAETAHIIAAELGLEVSTDAVFEELRPPSTVTESRSAWQRRILDLPWDQVPPELRCWRERLLGRIAESTVDTVMVTHFGVINAITSTLLGSRTFFVFAPRPGSITRLAVNWDQGLSLEKLGAAKESAA